MYKFILLRDALDLKAGVEFKVDTNLFSNVKDKPDDSEYNFGLRELMELESKGWVRKEDDGKRLISLLDYKKYQEMELRYNILVESKDQILTDIRADSVYWEGFKRGIDVMYNLLREGEVKDV